MYSLLLLEALQAFSPILASTLKTPRIVELAEL